MQRFRLVAKVAAPLVTGLLSLSLLNGGNIKLKGDVGGKNKNRIEQKNKNNKICYNGKCHKS